jgi:hypothetical protein
MSEPKKLSVSFKFNGEVKRKRTDDLFQTIEEVKPPLLHTEVYLTIKKDGHTIERRLGLIDARRIFRDEMARRIFINNIQLHQYV